ncbi:hypothetical protein [Paenibacillus sp. IITD108]|uniref:hypothetical protein n=1 Tax=Paenibacillus sp. IITD108 TaxID=3116649 RepID=UPI003FA752E1
MYRNEWANYSKDIPLICQRSGRTEKRVRDALNELVRLGYLEHKDGFTRAIYASQLERERYMADTWKNRY